MAKRTLQAIVNKLKESFGDLPLSIEPIDLTSCALVYTHRFDFGTVGMRELRFAHVFMLSQNDSYDVARWLGQVETAAEQISREILASGPIGAILCGWRQL